MSPTTIQNIRAATRASRRRLRARWRRLHSDRVALLVEQAADRLLVGPVGLVLESIDLDGVRRDPFALLQGLECQPHLVARRRDDDSQLARAEAHRLQAIEADERRRGVNG